MKRTTRKIVKIGLLTASFVTLLSMTPTASIGLPPVGAPVGIPVSAPVGADDPSADQNNPCSSLPRICHYTWDPMTRCCIADPKHDCTDVCFGPIIH